MKFSNTTLPGVILIEPDVFKDPRGFFLETYHKKKLEEGGIRTNFVQDNHSRSLKGTLRGLHWQQPHPQVKLVRVTLGEIFDVVVDVRIGSPTYKKWEGFQLSQQNFRMLYVPEGFAHGFVVVSDVAEVEYKCGDFYDKSAEATLLWNDAEIGVKWPVSSPILSDKDKNGLPLRELAGRLPAFK